MVCSDESPATFSYQLATHLTYSPAQVMTVALIKRTPILDPTTPLASQVHVMNLFGGDETPYESLHALVSSGVKPWFEAFVGSRGAGKDVDSKMGRFSPRSSWALVFTRRQASLRQRRSSQNWSCSFSIYNRTLRYRRHTSSYTP
jgi:hypothetical protein